jgi:hypothetical protein
MTAVGFEPTPLRNGALSHRLRPLGQTVLTISNGWQPHRMNVWCIYWAILVVWASILKCTIKISNVEDDIWRDKWNAFTFSLHISQLHFVISPHWGLNPGPSVCRTDALPLSYRGICFCAERKYVCAIFVVPWIGDSLGLKQAVANARPQLRTSILGIWCWFCMIVLWWRMCVLCCKRVQQFLICVWIKCA